MKTDLNQDFFSTGWFTQTKEPNLPKYLPIDIEIILVFIHFPMVLVLCEMQKVSSRIWTRVAVPVSSDDNSYTTVHPLCCKILWVLLKLDKWWSIHCTRHTVMVIQYIIWLLYLEKKRKYISISLPMKLWLRGCVSPIILGRRSPGGDIVLC